MKKYVVLIACLASVNAFAYFMDTPASIHAIDGMDKDVIINLDAEGYPQVQGDAEYSPNITDFGDDAEFGDFCYTGITEESVSDLFVALVESASDDEGTTAEIKTLGKGANLEVNLTYVLTQGGNTKETALSFPVCE